MENKFNLCSIEISMLKIWCENVRKMMFGEIIAKDHIFLYLQFL